MNSTVEILMIEDNEGDVFLTREALKVAKVANNLTVARDGIQALELLHRNGKYPAGTRPDLILLDLNLPGRDGRQVLADIKSDPELAAIPVVVLTSSQAEQDIARAYELHANCYIIKPVDFQKLMDIVIAIESFWLSIVKLPSQGKH
jgi:two-component system, chemotaxis family, response regulator Rcp1